MNMRRYQMTVLSIYTRPFFMLVVALLALCGQPGFAETAQPAKEPQVIVEKVTQELFSLVKAKKANSTADEAYYEQVKGTLDSVVNFPFIAKAVMGKSFDGAS